MTATNRAAVPHDLRGRILDCDGHFYLEPETVVAMLGEHASADWVIDGLFAQKRAPDHAARQAAARERVWEIKGLAALGSTDAGDRVRALDAMGIERQLLFPNTSLRELRYATPAALAAMRAYNDIAVAWSRSTGDRARVVCQINMRDLDVALAEARRVVDAGARGVLVPCAYPPAGTSPANPLWDPFWELLEQTNTPVLLHMGTGGLLEAPADDPVLFDRAFADSPTLRSTFADQPGGEERIGPLWIAVAHLAPELWLTVTVMGGLFERFPRLRVGIIEFGAQWFGPLAERLDVHAGLMAKVGAPMPMEPSEYLRRNVRVTPFYPEPVDVFIERFGVPECYVFSTDYPHLEGGRDPIGRFLGRVQNVSPSYVDDFFVNNGELLFP